ncbi:MAG: hypothetical protein JNL07_11415 [Rhodospirillales bacterium]|nr:hypothetical protein [Rhodospirillales bacterium]
MWPADLAEASEMFLTGTAAEIAPVRELDGRAYTVGALTTGLIDDFAALVARDDCEGFGESAHLMAPALDRAA